MADFDTQGMLDQVTGGSNGHPLLTGAAVAGVVVGYSALRKHQFSQARQQLWAQCQQDTINSMGPAAYSPQGQYTANQLYQSRVGAIDAAQAHSHKRGQVLAWSVVAVIVAFFIFCFIMGNSA